MEDGKQTGCSLNRLDKFDDKIWDDKTQCYIINRLCTTCRNQDWANKQKEDLEIAVKKETRIRYAYVLCDASKIEYKNCLENLKSTLYEIEKQAIKPEEIVFVTNNPYVIPKMASLAKTILAQYQHLPVKLVKTMEEDACVERLFDIGSKKISKSLWMSCHDINGQELPNDFMLYIEKAINRKMMSFVAIEENVEKLYPEIVMVPLYKMLDGNNGGFILDKIKEKAKAEKKEGWIITWDKVLESIYS